MRTKPGILALALSLGGCSSIPLEESAREVRILYSMTPPPDCRLIGDIVGSAGHWYSYLFITNANLSLGALNDIKNKARKLGGNTVRVVSNREFVTSVTLIGQAYDCR